MGFEVGGARCPDGYKVLFFPEPDEDKRVVGEPMCFRIGSRKRFRQILDPETRRAINNYFDAGGAASTFITTTIYGLLGEDDFGVSLILTDDSLDSEREFEKTAKTFYGLWRSEVEKTMNGVSVKPSIFEDPDLVLIPLGFETPLVYKSWPHVYAVAVRSPP